MRTLRPYPEYAASKVRWLPTMPAAWTSRRIKTYLREVDVRSGTGEGALLTLRRERGLIPLSDVSDKISEPGKLRHYKTASTGQIVMNPMQAGIGTFAICRTPGLISPDYRAFELIDEADARYLLACFKVGLMRATFRAESKGLGTGTAGFLRLYPDRFLSLFAPYPPPEEQRRIADFLDAYTAHVQRLIAAKRRTMAALVERKRAVISDRLYDVTAAAALPTPHEPGWPMRALKRIATVSFSSVDKHVHAHERPVRVCNYVDVYKHDQIQSRTELRDGSVTESEFAAFSLRKGDVLITKDSEDWHDICVPSLVADEFDDVVCGYHLAILRPHPQRLMGEYLYYALLAAPTAWQFHRAATGITRYGLGKNDIGAALIPLPPLAIQRHLCRELDAELSSIDEAKARIATEIDLIAEYRDALVAAVVTGRLDVREAEVAFVPGGEPADEPDPEDMEDALDADD